MATEPSADRTNSGKTDDIPLVDHHCHGIVTGELSRPEFELLITESSDPAPPGTSPFDSQLGLILRRWCPPVLGLDAYAQPHEYLDRRRELGVGEASRRLLRAAGVADFLVDTGYQPRALTSPAELATAADARAHTVVRLERVAEDLAGTGVGAQEFAVRYPGALADAAAGAVAAKSVAAYRHGLDLEPSRPEPNEVARAAAVWLHGVERFYGADPATEGRVGDEPEPPGGWAADPTGGGPRGGGPPPLRSPVLLRFLLWSAVDLGLPVQIHTGFGDRDLALHRSNPALLTGLIHAVQPAGVPLVLLHCYPYHREAGYLAHIYPHVYCDVGLALNFTGARAHAILAETLELTPFGKMLYSSDAFGLPELHYLGAMVFRRAFARLSDEWVRGGMLTEADARRIALLIGAGNARRVYRLAG